MEETKKTIADYEQQIERLQSTMEELRETRTQCGLEIARYKQQIENSEKNEDQLKVEKRKLMREVSHLHLSSFFHHHFHHLHSIFTLTNIINPMVLDSNFCSYQVGTL